MKSLLSRWLASGASVALLGVIVGWNAWLSPPHSAPVSLVLLGLGLPLLATLPGLLRGTPRTHVVAALVALAYLTFGVLEAWVRPPEREYGIAVSLLAALVFAGAMLRVLSLPKVPRGGSRCHSEPPGCGAPRSE
jgi:uncharacterized membrane protein